MNHPRSRSLYLAAALAVAAACALPPLIGCDAKRATPGGGTQLPAAHSTGDGESAALADLETKPDAEHCRTALQQLDNLGSAASRPALSESERGEIARLLNLTPAETTEIGQTTFSQADAGYLEECLLVRAGVRALKIDARPPLERARIAFDWVCRMVYINDRWPAPTNPWTTLQIGSGVALSRAYVVLAAWQQLGLDGCVVGPPDLERTPSIPTPDPSDPTAKLKYAPLRACAVKVGADLFLFDPAGGTPVEGADGKGPLTLAQVKADPDAAKGLAATDEVKTWQPFLAPTISGLGRRMEWLQRFDPGNVQAKLFIDVARQRAEFAKDLPSTPVAAWNPERDLFSASRVLATFAAEGATTRKKLALRDALKVAMIPLEHLPKTNLAGNALAHIQSSFARPFESLRYTPDSARDLLLRGHYSEATTTLESMKTTVDNARARMEQDKGVQRDFEAWSDEFQRLAAQVLRAERDDPASVPAATQMFDRFRSLPRSQDIERAFVLGNAARPLGAEVTYLTAAAVHERAERAQLDANPQAPALWQNAVDWWERFLDASLQARSPYPPREAHAKSLLARARKLAGK
ncbi:MAG: hypothetical protein J2P46_20870 [Zavarzinella sp.]|nr:hypothetical protein [Zavarzinella sp.]